MQQILLVIQSLLATALIGIVLLQRSDSDGFGLGSGSGTNFLSGRATANLLTRTTAILATLFIINSLILSIVASSESKESILDVVNKQETVAPASAPAPAAAPKETAPASTPATATTEAPAAAIAPAAAPAVPVVGAPETKSQPVVTPPAENNTSPKAEVPAVPSDDKQP